jgi:metal-dependent HD superfamily phosphatase/phosphodiesterase
MTNLEGQAGVEPLTYQQVQASPVVREMIAAADAQMAALGYTEHGMRHSTEVAEKAGDILTELACCDQRTVELAQIAGLLHDIGNLVSREMHAQTGALLALDLLREMRMGVQEASRVAAAIGGHDEEEGGEPTTDIGAAVIIADKADVARERVRNPIMAAFDIHDRINYAAQETSLTVQPEDKTITLKLAIDTKIGSVMEYFEIFLSRMVISRRSARVLGAHFRLVINDVPLI